MSELDGNWDVRRISGALPPLVGVRKRIAGASGETVVAGRGVPFDVRGRELRYRAPFAFLVDTLEPRGDGWHGRATAFGRTYGEFELRRVNDMNDMNAQLVKHLDEAHALEQTVLRLLDGLIAGADDPGMIDRLEHHRIETRHHESTMRRRLEAHGAQPSMVRQATAMLEALVKLPLDLVRSERSGRAARELYTTEHLEIASYELLRRVAERAGDEETAAACKEILEQERAMAAFVEDNWDRFAELSLREAGVGAAAGS